LDNWLVNSDLNWSLVDGLWNSNFLDNSSDGDFWLNSGHLGSDLGVSSDWSENLFLGDKWLKVTSLGSSDSDDLLNRGSLENLLNWSSMDNLLNRSSSSGLDNYGIVANGNLLDWGSCDLLQNWGSMKNVSSGNCWLDDGGGISSHNRLGLVVNGLGQGDLDSGNGWSSND
jgi:hypothetical protein